MGVYERLGVRPIINATCHWTDYGGAQMWPEVIEAMADARRQYVNVHALIDRAGAVISRYTHAEATHIVSGCSAGLLAGAAAIGPNTAGVYWLCDNPSARIDLADVVDVAHQHNLPVLLDASNTLPPPEHIHRFIDLGVDLAAFSGGKGLRGPQGSGFLTGRADLIRAARLQSSPNDGVGRSLKVSKEEMVGLVTAIEIWSQRDHAGDMEDAKRRTHDVVSELAGMPGARVEYRFPDHIGRPYPTVFVHLDPAAGRTGREVIAALLAGDPSIATMDFADPWVVRADVRILDDGEVAQVARRLREVLTTD